MSKRCLSKGGRPKAFWGAVIPAIASLAGSIISSSMSAKNQRDALKSQQEEQNRQNLMQQNDATARTLNNYLSSWGDDEDELRVLYKKGGRRKLRNAAMITDGGVAIPLGNGTYLLQGGSHNQVNESGQTGIGINAGGKEIEAEDGEVVQNKGNELRIFSAQPILNGVSPSEAVISGVNKDKVFRQQEAIKQRRHLRNGYSSPVGRDRAAWGATFTTPDYIGLGTNVLASILSGVVANKNYNNLLKDINFTLPEYVDESFVAGPTRWRNEAQKADVMRNDINARLDTSRNTSSSNVALDRMQTIGTNTMYELNKLDDEKSNKEAEMRMKNAEMYNQSLARRAAARNAWLQSVAEIKNKELATRLGLQEAKVNSNVGMIQGIGSSIGGFLQQGIDRYENEQARRALFGSSENGSVINLVRAGYRISNRDMVNAYNDALDNYNRTGSDKDAYEVAFYAKRLGPKLAKRYNLRTPRNSSTSFSETLESI